MMKIINFLFLITILHIFHTVRASDERKGRLFDGDDLNLGDKLFFAQLLVNGSADCGASIISERWLITAGHCVTTWRESPSSFSVMTGSIVREDSHKPTDTIEDIIIHPHYTYLPLYNDIALIKLKNSIRFDSYVTRIAIAERPPRVGDQMQVFGLGRVGDNSNVDTRLRSITIPVVNSTRCQANHRYFDQVYSFCAGLGLKDSCIGDSGGPGVINGKLAGIVSYGPRCAMKKPGVYTNVYAYRDWIESVVAPGFNL